MSTQSKGLHLDTDKPPLELISSHAILEMAKVMGKGRKKYSAHNWRKGIEWSRIIASILRHSLAYLDGETLDSETNLSHMAHIMCDASFLLEYEITHPELDDRYKKENN